MEVARAQLAFLIYFLCLEMWCAKWGYSI